MLTILSYMSPGPLYVLLGEVSVQVLCPFFNWIVCLPGVESCEFFIYFEDQTLAGGIVAEWSKALDLDSKFLYPCNILHSILLISFFFFAASRLCALTVSLCLFLSVSASLSLSFTHTTPIIHFLKLITNFHICRHLWIPTSCKSIFLCSSQTLSSLQTNITFSINFLRLVTEWITLSPVLPCHTVHPL